MKRFLFLLIFLTSFTFGCCVLQSQIPSVNPPLKSTNPEFVANLQRSSVALLGTRDSEYRTRCTGVWISSNRILTANHCVKAGLGEEEIPGKIITYQLEDELNKDYPPVSPSFAYYSMVEAVDQDNDLAVLSSIDEVSHPYVKISKDKIFDGGMVHLVGHTDGFLFTYMPGTISKSRYLLTHGHYTKILQITSAIWFGNSGGGAFNENGELVGVCSAINGDMPNMSFYIHLDTVRKFLDENHIYLDD